MHDTKGLSSAQNITEDFGETIKTSNDSNDSGVGYFLKSETIWL